MSRFIYHNALLSVKTMVNYKDDNIKNFVYNRIKEMFKERMLKTVCI